MVELTTSQARRDFNGTLKRASRGERIILSRHKKGVAAIVSLEDLALLQAIEDRMDARAARRALAEAEAHGTTAWEQIKADLKL